MPDLRLTSLLLGLFGWAVVGTAYLPRAADAQTAEPIWELRPYQVRVEVLIDPDAAWSEPRRAAVPTRLQARLELSAGSLWRTKAELAGPEAARFARRLKDGNGLVDASSEAAAAVQAWGGVDKWILARVARSETGYRIEAREFDRDARVWGARVERRSASAEGVDAALAAAVRAAFRPTARVEPGEKDAASLRVRGGGLTPRDERFQPVSVGAAFQAYRPTAAVAAWREIPWTCLVVEKTIGPSAAARVHSRYAEPLKSSDPVMALGVPATRAAASLRLASSLDPTVPLAGYDLLEREPSRSDYQPLGRTDFTGRAALPAREGPVRILLVRNGSRVLARLPILSSDERELTATLTPDDERLALEGLTVQLRQALVDAAASRELSAARFRAQLAAKKYDEAEKTVEELQAFEKTRVELERRIQEQRLAAEQAHPDAAKALAGVYQDLTDALNKHLGAVAAQQAAQALADGRESVFHEFTSADKRFSVQLPGTPEEAKPMLDSPVGQLPLVHVQSRLKSPEVRFDVWQFDLPNPQTHATPEAALDAAAALIASRTNLGTPEIAKLENRPVPARKLTGSDAVVELWYASPRVYAVSAFGAKESLTGPEVVGYFDSFRVLGQ